MNKNVRKLLDKCEVMGADEKDAVISALDAGEKYGYGNLMSWLATEWGCNLIDEGLDEKSALYRVSHNSPYNFPACSEECVKCAETIKLY